jgi:putative ABC transport system permease protein
VRFTSLVIKNLARRRFRTLLTLIALGTAIGAVVALLGITKGFTNSFADVYAAHGVDVVVSRQGSADRLSSSVDESFVNRIGVQPGVDRSEGVLLETLSFEEQGVFGIPSMGIVPDSWMLQEYRMRSGSSLKSDQPRSLLLGLHLADRLGVQLGDSLKLFDEPYKVVGVFESQSTWENGSMILPLTQLQSITDRRGQVTYINVVLERPVSGTKAKEAIKAIETLDAKLLALVTDDFVKTDTRMQLAGAMAWMTSIVAMVIGAIGTLNTMMTSVFERTREIGILRAIGWSRQRIVTMIVAESCVMAIIASVVGGVLAIVCTTLLSMAPAAKGILSPAIDAGTLFQGFVLALAIGVLGALLPAWRAAQMQPTDAFREG